MKIDWWTLALQTINVIVLLWVLRHFLFKPVQTVIANRQQELHKQIEDTAAERQLAVTQRLALDAERAAIATTREQMLAAARNEAHEAGQALLAQAAEDASRRSTLEQAALRQERVDAEAALRQAAAKLTGDMLLRLLERFPAAGIDCDFLQGACDALRAMNTGARKLVLDSAAKEPLQIISAHRLDAMAQTMVLQKLGESLEGMVTASFSTDSHLLAGIELRFRHIVISNNWAADLQNIMESLNNDALQHA